MLSFAKHYLTLLKLSPVCNTISWVSVKDDSEDAIINNMTIEAVGSGGDYSVINDIVIQSVSAYIRLLLHIILH